MSETRVAPETSATTDRGSGGLLEQVVAATRQTEPDRAQELVKTLVEQALTGTVTFDRNLPRTIDRAIAAIDQKLSTQLNAVMHHPRFLQLEGTWRGLNYLVMNSETGTSLKLRVLNAAKARPAIAILTRAVEFDQSQLFKQIYENEFGTPGGEPYGALIGDYEWTNHPDDIETSAADVERGGGRLCAVHLRRPAPSMFGFRGLDGAVQAARPGKDLRDDRNTRSGAASATREDCAIRQSRHAARDRPAALWRDDQADRRIRLRGSAVRRGGRRARR